VMGVAVAIVIAAACAVAFLGWRARPTGAQRTERCA